MSKAPWTAGPWTAETRHANMIDVVHHSKKSGAITRALCRVQARNSWVEEAIANARLIAEAPAMADALDMLIVARNLPSDHPDMKKALIIVRAILARAKGEA